MCPKSPRKHLHPPARSASLFTLEVLSSEVKQIQRDPHPQASQGFSVVEAKSSKTSTSREPQEFSDAWWHMEPLVASLLLVAMPGAPGSFLFLVVLRTTERLDGMSCVVVWTFAGSPLSLLCVVLLGVFLLYMLSTRKHNMQAVLRSVSAVNIGPGKAVRSEVGHCRGPILHSRTTGISASASVHSDGISTNLVMQALM